MKYHRLGSLNNRHLFAYSSRGEKLTIKILEGLVSPVASLPGLQMDSFSLCLSSVCVYP